MATKYLRDNIWEKSKPVQGKDKNLYRYDPYDNVMYKPSCGKSSHKGWDIDHIKPRAKGGSDSSRRA